MTALTRFFSYTLLALLLGNWYFVPAAHGAPPDTTRGDEMFAQYFRNKTSFQANGSPTHFDTAAEWREAQGKLRAQLFDMLGLQPPQAKLGPLPENTDLRPVITGTLEKNLPEGDIVVEKLHFQPLPGLYVTANLYRPKVVKEPLPTILYVCGHSQQKKGNVSLGNKTAYQHHGIWFARKGYVCLVLDSLQLGEIEGIHHGTHRYNMWWWINRGYTPAGVEAWNCIRALDYLETRPEVDKTRFGVTGRSGGGAYSWWIAALDERIKCAAPCAGITDLRNHVVDGCIEGHCDCMFMHNTQQWDYPTVAALVAPRPLLIVNTDSDPIFPLNGVVRVFEKARSIYKLLGAADKIALAIGPGGHKDTQEIQFPAFRWFNKHLQGHERPITIPAEKMFEYDELRVFDKLPADAINAKIHETFVAKAPEPTVPDSKEAWQRQREEWLKQLRERTFRGWPEKDGPLNMKLVFDEQADGVQLRGWDFTSEDGIELRLYLAQRAQSESNKQTLPTKIHLQICDTKSWESALESYVQGFGKKLRSNAELRVPTAEELEQYREIRNADSWKNLTVKVHTVENAAMAFVAPRNFGRTVTNPDKKYQTQLRRRFMVLGETLESQQIYDIRRAIQAIRSIDELAEIPLKLFALGEETTGLTLYAALFEPKIAGVLLFNLPVSHREGPILFNVERILDLPQVVAMVAEQTKLHLGWTEPLKPSVVMAYPLALQKQLGWKEQLTMSDDED